MHLITARLRSWGDAVHAIGSLVASGPNNAAPVKVLAALERAPRDSTKVTIRTQWLLGNGASGEL
jgi:hypothetical protein